LLMFEAFLRQVVDASVVPTMTPSGAAMAEPA
jgi:hypothetical protein